MYKLPEFLSYLRGWDADVPCWWNSFCVAPSYSKLIICRLHVHYQAYVVSVHYLSQSIRSTSYLISVSRIHLLSPSAYWFLECIVLSKRLPCSKVGILFLVLSARIVGLTINLSCCGSFDLNSVFRPRSCSLSCMRSSVLPHEYVKVSISFRVIRTCCLQICERLWCPVRST